MRVRVCEEREREREERVRKQEVWKFTKRFKKKKVRADM
jgi:hypothetical protein